MTVVEERGAPGAAVADARRTPVTAPSGTASKLSQADWKRAERDPFVERVREVVDGTLLEVRVARPTEKIEPREDHADRTEDTSEDVTNEE